MMPPKRINYTGHRYLLAMADIIVCSLLFFWMKFVHSDIDIVLPQFLMLNPIPQWVQTAIFSLYWLVLFTMSGLYRHVGKKGFGWYSSAHIATCFAGAVGFTFLFFVKNDYLYNYGFFHFFIEFFVAVTLSIWIVKMLYYYWLWLAMRRGRLAIHVLLVGTNKEALQVFSEYSISKTWYRYYFAGCVSANESEGNRLPASVPLKGALPRLSNILDENPVDEVMVAIDSHEYKKVEHVLSSIRHKAVTIKLLPDLNAILEGTVKTADIKGLPLITINHRLMPEWQVVMKWLFDRFVSFFALLLFLPFLLLVIFLIKRSSPGPVFYRQERVGKGRKIFRIIKFRSMYVDAEEDGPALSSSNDKRVTPFGKVMRKWHIDEIPQFVNVLMGDMSIVGPRPERVYFIDQLTKVAPHYNHLFCVKPGITSWGMVKYGYAENVQQMLARMEYDILYLENISFVVDMKIILYTIKEIYSGRGK